MPPAGAVDSARPFLPMTKPTDQACSHQVPSQQKQVPSASATRSTHQPEADSDLDDDMDNDLTDNLALRHTEEESYLTVQDCTAAKADQLLSEEQNY